MFTNGTKHFTCSWYVGLTGICNTQFVLQSGSTALAIAISMHHLEIVKILIASGAFVKEKDEVNIALISLRCS